MEVTRERPGRFRGKNRRHDYEIHYRRQHLADDVQNAQVGVTQAEARAIYAEVYPEMTVDSVTNPSFGSTTETAEPSTPSSVCGPGAVPLPPKETS